MSLSSEIATLLTLLESDLLAPDSQLLESLNAVLAESNRIGTRAPRLLSKIARDVYKTYETAGEDSAIAKIDVEGLTDTLTQLLADVKPSPSTFAGLERFKTGLSTTSAAYSSALLSDTLTSDTLATDALTSDASATTGCNCPACCEKNARLSSLPSDALAFTTIARNGQRIYNGQGNAQSLKWTRPGNSNNSTGVTFAFDDDFAVNGLSLDKSKSLIVDALKTWSKYAPLDFQEVSDPGSTSKVDILVQSKAIDGRGKTLAYAYFPSVGDITFDTSENWSETKFLETAVHELGHSLGLDHEDDTDAIMNSVLGNKFAGKDEAFLLQDDIRGVRYLYGNGKGSVKTLGNSGQDQAQDDASKPDSNNDDGGSSKESGNLVVNGSFEDTPVKANSYGLYSQIKGWSMISGAGFQVDRRERQIGNAADGSAWIELDANGQNSTIGQNVDTVTGEDYTISVDFTSGGRNRQSTAIDVFWAGRRIDTLTGGGKGNWKTYRYQVKGGNRQVSTLAFRAVGKSDNRGGFIDNVSVFAKSNLTDDLTNDYILGASAGPSGQLPDALSNPDFAPELMMKEQPGAIFPDTAVLA